MTPSSATEAMRAAAVDAAPLVDGHGLYIGVVPLETTRGVVIRHESSHLSQLIDAGYSSLNAAELLDTALETITSTSQTWAPVVDDYRSLVGTIAISDVVASYRQAICKTTCAERPQDDGHSGAAYTQVAEHAALVDVPLRSQVIPRGILVTSIERGRQVLQPTGDTVIRAGDHLTVLGSPDDVERLERLASSSPHTAP